MKHFIISYERLSQIEKDPIYGNPSLFAVLETYRSLVSQKVYRSVHCLYPESKSYTKIM